MLNDVLGLAIATVVLFCACITTWAWAHHTVATESIVASFELEAAATSRTLRETAHQFLEIDPS